MTDQGKKYLTDIIHAIDLIESFTSGISGYDEYIADLKHKVQLKDNLASLEKL
jgi:uncharacterized protein with HEPN domain